MAGDTARTHICTTCLFLDEDQGQCKVLCNQDAPTSTRWLAAEYLDGKNAGRDEDCQVYKPRRGTST